MRLKSFELDEPVPALKDPHAIAILKPWVDVGRAGTVTMKWIEDTVGVRDLAKLSRPGEFIDFTRHRPTSYVSAGRRRMTIPNTYVTCCKRETGNDLIFFHLLEPHTHGDEYVESVLELMKHFGVKRYTIIGSMHDYVPHTRPFIVTGEAVGQETQMIIEQNEIEAIEYRGPTSICFLISQSAPEMGIESLSLIAHLPQYTQMDEDYTGALRLMNIISNIYDIPVDQKHVHKSERQLEQINDALESNPQIKTIINQLENHYDTRGEKPEQMETTELSPEIEQFLAEMDKRFREESS
jgi:hypothetical protein